MKQSLDRLSRDLKRGSDATKGEARQTFYCGYFTLFLLTAVAIAAIPFLQYTEEVIARNAAMGTEGQAGFVFMYALVAIGAPIRALDVVLPLFYPLPDALLLAFLGRFLGLTLCFLLSKLCLQRPFESYLSSHNCNTFYLVVHRYPLLYMTLFRLVYWPTGAESYFCAAFNVGFWEFIIPAMVTEGGVAAAQMYFGRETSNLHESLDFLSIRELDVLFLSVVFGISVLSLILIVLFARKHGENAEELKRFAAEGVA